MAESPKTLRRRLRSIVNMKQITRAMEMVAAARLRQSQRVLLEARPFAHYLQLLLGQLAPAAEAVGHPFFVARAVKKSTLVVFSSDRGLCGSYNAQVIKQAERTLSEHNLGSVELVCIGRRVADYFSRRKWPVAARYTDFSGKADIARSNEISDFLCKRYMSGETDQVYLIYNTYLSTSTYRTTNEKFLDLDQSALMRDTRPEDRIALEYIYEPSREEVFAELVPFYLNSKIFITMVEALTSEHSARMLAMNNATRNCDELVDSLTLDYFEVAGKPHREKVGEILVVFYEQETRDKGRGHVTRLPRILGSGRLWGHAWRRLGI